MMEGGHSGLIMLCLATVGAVLVMQLACVVQHHLLHSNGGRCFHKQLASEIGWALAPMLVVVALLLQVLSLTIFA